MSSDRRQFAHATQKWHDLYDNNKFSVLSRDGICTIFRSNTETFSIGDDSKEFFDYSDREIVQLCEAYDYLVRDIRIIDGLTRAALMQAVQDPEVSDLVIIGHGDISAVYLDDYAEEKVHSTEKIDWRDISKMSTHLKLGHYIHRCCGNYLRDLNVPFGTFMLQDHGNTIAPFNSAFEPETYNSDESLMKLGIHQSPLSYDYIKTNLVRRKSRFYTD